MTESDHKLLEKYINGLLSEVEKEDLSKRLLEEEDLADSLKEKMKMHSLLASAFTPSEHISDNLEEKLKLQNSEFEDQLMNKINHQFTSKKRVKTLWVFAAAAILVFGFLAINSILSKKETQQEFYAVKEITGAPILIQEGSEKPLQSDYRLTEGDQIKTGTGSVLISRGDEKITVNKNSLLSIKEIGKSSKFHINEGDIFVDFPERNSGRKFLFVTKDVSARITGTAFRIGQDQNRGLLKMTRGSVELTAFGKKYELKDSDLVKWEDEKVKVYSAADEKKRNIALGKILTDKELVLDGDFLSPFAVFKGEKSDVISLPRKNSEIQNLTVSLWVKAHEIDKSIFISQRDYSPEGGLWEVGIKKNIWTVTYGHGGKISDWRSAGSIEAVRNKWTHLCLVFELNKDKEYLIDFYVNGESDSVKTRKKLRLSQLNFGGKVTLGGLLENQWAKSLDLFNGEIGQVHFLSKALTATEVTELFKNSSVDFIDQ